MVRTRGPRLTPAQQMDVWRRWRQGESLSAIGRALGRIPRTVDHVVAGAGGMPPPSRQRSRLALTLAEREEMSRGLAPVSRHRRRPPGVEAESAPEALSLGHVSRAAGGRRDQTRT